MRRLLFWAHLGAGILVSLLVLYFAITGAMLAFERPLLHWAEERSFHPDSAAASQSPIPLDDLLAKAAPALPSPIDSISVQQNQLAPVEILTTDRSVFLIDRRSGRVEGPVSPRLRAFFNQATALHRWFGLDQKHHAAATSVKGGSTLVFFFVLLSGALLWLPARWTPAALRSGMVPRFDQQGRARNYNWHKVAGFWIGAPLAVIAFTGVIMAFPWANAALFKLAGSPMPVREGGGRGPRHSEVALPGHLADAFALAAGHQADWRTLTLRLPPSHGGLNFTIDAGDGGQPQKRTQLVVSTKTAEIVHVDAFADLSRGQRWRSWVRFVHTGEAGGWWGETLASITAGGAMLLSITGIALFLARMRRLLGVKH